jgi:alpha-L-fucosidase
MKTPLTRRSFLKTSALVAGGAAATRFLPSCGSVSAPKLTTAPSGRRIAAGPFQPTWESLAGQYRYPAWFRDAKFGIWAHWSAQCVPEQGDWYARRIYQQGDAHNLYHVKTYGHPTKFGFMEINNLWKAERWEPEKLMALYKRAGAKYFFALANHHDNFDNYNSRYHAWNSVNVGPKKDLIGGWAKAARAEGMRFGVTNHAARSWLWFQAAYGYDAEGPLAGQRYDAYTLTKADGKGKWWDGLDPQELYCGRSIVIPDGFKTPAEMSTWRRANEKADDDARPAVENPAFMDKWFLRCQDLIDSYQPDVVYFDNTQLPLGQAGLDIAAHYYNASLARNGSAVDVVINAKKMTDAHRPALVEDIERGVADGIRPLPWQTDTCIGDWHYNRSFFDRHRYKTAPQVIQMLIDIVSKNGNLMLNIPVRGDGSIDSDEVAVLEGIAEWMAKNSEGIFATGPWKVYGEGPSMTGPAQRGQFGGARDVRAYAPGDMRFTCKGGKNDGVLFAFLLAPPAGNTAVIRSLATGSPHLDGSKVKEVVLLGHGPVRWAQNAEGLQVTLPENLAASPAHTLKIDGVPGAYWAMNRMT